MYSNETISKRKGKNKKDELENESQIINKPLSSILNYDLDSTESTETEYFNEDLNN